MQLAATEHHKHVTGISCAALALGLPMLAASCNTHRTHHHHVIKSTCVAVCPACVSAESRPLAAPPSCVQALHPRYTLTRGEGYCVALRGYIAKCRARFGALVLRCDLAEGKATACNSASYRLVKPTSKNACGAAMTWP